MESEIAKAVAIAVSGLIVAGIVTFLLRAHFGKSGSHDGPAEATEGRSEETPPPSHSDKELASYSSWGDLIKFSKEDKVHEKHCDPWFGIGHSARFSMALRPIPPYKLNRKISELGTQVVNEHRLLIVQTLMSNRLHPLLYLLDEARKT